MGSRTLIDSLRALAEEHGFVAYSHLGRIEVRKGAAALILHSFNANTLRGLVMDWLADVRGFGHRPWGAAQDGTEWEDRSTSPPTLRVWRKRDDGTWGWTLAPADRVEERSKEGAP